MDNIFYDLSSAIGGQMYGHPNLKRERLYFTNATVVINDLEYEAEIHYTTDTCVELGESLVALRSVIIMPGEGAFELMSDVNSWLLSEGQRRQLCEEIEVGLMDQDESFIATFNRTKKATMRRDRAQGKG